MNSEIIFASILVVGGGLAGFLGATFFFEARGSRAEIKNIRLVNFSPTSVANNS